jgi:hypothetical protein
MNALAESMILAEANKLSPDLVLNFDGEMLVCEHIPGGINFTRLMDKSLDEISTGILKPWLDRTARLKQLRDDLDALGVA